MPVLAIGGAASYGEQVGEAMKLLADDVQSVVIPGAGHWVAEQAPDDDAGGADGVPGPVPGRGAHTQAGCCRGVDACLPVNGHLRPFPDPHAPARRPDSRGSW